MPLCVTFVIAKGEPQWYEGKHGFQHGVKKSLWGNKAARNGTQYFSNTISKSTISSMEKTKITINNNGSIKIDGEVELLDPQGNAYGLGGRTIISLCRCGHSANKPFCDGAHRANGFEDQCMAFDLPPKKVA